MENFYSAYARANLFYDLDIPNEDFEEMGLVAWNKIGNKQTKLYRFKTLIDDETLSLDLPCNCLQLEAVTYNIEDWQYTTNYSVNGEVNSSFVEQYIETRKQFKNPLYQYGKFAKYELVNNTLYFDKNYGEINILYKGIFVNDEDGLPFLYTDKEIQAIAAFCAYTKRFKDGWKSHNQLMLQEAKLLEQEWLKLCSAARIPDFINQNDMNEILDARTSWNRKLFGKSFKPLK